VHHFLVVVVKLVEHARVVVLVGHCSLFGSEHTWLIHVNPEVVNMAAASEPVWFVHALPVVACLTVEEVNPCGVSGPTAADECLITAVLNKEVLVGFCPDWVIFINLDLRVCNYDDCSILIFNLLIH